MNPITAIVIEDEIPQRQELLSMLGAAWPELKIVAVCGDGLHAIDAITELKPDCIFVDIRIPGVSGIEVAKHAATLGCAVVFTTAYDHYAVEAFNQKAIDYLLKPIAADRLSDCIERLKNRLQNDQNSGESPQIGHLEIDKNFKTEPLTWIMAGGVSGGGSGGSTIKMVAIDEVLFFQSQDKYPRVFTATMDTHIRTPLKELLQGLDDNKFWLIHRNAIVRVDAIETVKRDDTGKMWVQLRGKKEALAVSSAHQSRFKIM